MNVDMERAPAKASIMKQTNSVGDLERAAVKACVIAQLLPFLHPRLLQDGMPLVEAAPLLAKIHINVLQAALATGNVQPVLAKLKAGAYQQPAMRKVGSAENLPVLQKMLLTLPEPGYTN